MNDHQIREIEKHLGRHLTPEEKRLLRYTEDKQPLRPFDNPPQPPPRGKAARPR